MVASQTMYGTHFLFSLPRQARALRMSICNHGNGMPWYSKDDGRLLFMICCRILQRSEVNVSMLWSPLCRERNYRCTKINRNMLVNFVCCIIISVYVSIAAWLTKISNLSCNKLALSNFYFWHFWKIEMENKKLAVLWAVGAVFWLQWTWPLDLCHRAASYSSPVDGAGSWGSAW